MSERQTKAIAKKAPSGSMSMQQYVKSMEPAIAKALPSVITPERFTRIVLSAISVNPKLADCTPQSFMGAMMTAAQLGVEPNTPLGQAYLIPYRNKGKLECQFQLGYKGMIDMAWRSGQISAIQAHTVFEKDEFEYTYGLDPTLKHIPTKSGNKGKAVFYYAIFKTKDGGYGFEVMSREDVEKHARDYSQAYKTGFSPWSKNFDEMAKKTVLKKALKYAPLKTDFIRELNADETIKHYDSDEDLPILDIADETEYDVEEAAETVEAEPVQETIVK